MTWANLLL